MWSLLLYLDWVSVFSRLGSFTRLNFLSALTSPNRSPGTFSLLLGPLKKVNTGCRHSLSYLHFKKSLYVLRVISATLSFRLLTHSSVSLMHCWFSPVYFRFQSLQSLLLTSSLHFLPLCSIYHCIHQFFSVQCTSLWLLLSTPLLNCLSPFHWITILKSCLVPSFERFAIVPQDFLAVCFYLLALLHK